MGIELKSVDHAISGMSLAQQARPTSEVADTHWLEDFWMQAAQTSTGPGQKLFQAIVEGSIDAVFAKDLEGRYLYLNAAAERLLGKTRRQILGQDDAAVFSAAESRKFIEADRSVRLSGAPITSEEQFRDGTGRLRCVLVNRGPLRDAAGQVRGTFGIAHDVTEAKDAQRELRRARDEQELRVVDRTADLKRTISQLQREMDERQAAQEALRQSEEQYRLLFQWAPVGICLSTEQGKVLEANQHLCQIFGITPAEAKSMRSVSVYRSPADRRRILAEVRKKGVVEARELPLQRKDGTTLIGLVWMQQIAVAGQKLLLSIIQDVTRQREAERRLEGLATLLELFVTRFSRQKYLDAAVRLLADWCGCRCVGVRLVDEQHRLPYAAQVGFTAEFLRHEDPLLLKPKGACACVRVLLGHGAVQDRTRSTIGGSFYCNNLSQCATELAACPAQDATVPCVKAGYQSLAHSPIRYHGELLGTLHLADKHPNKFPAATVTFLEAVAPLIGEAIQRFRMEEALAESEQRFRFMFERHQAIMLLIDPESEAVIDANPAAAAFYGYSRDRLRAMNLSQINLLPPEALAAARSSAQRERRSIFVFPHRLANGEVRTVEVHSSPIEIKGRPILFNIIQDITERKRLQKLVLDVGEQERRRVGQDLHDSLGGRLTGAALMGKAMARTLAAEGRPDASLAREIVECINDAISQTRSIAHGLAPLELSVAGLVRALEDLAVSTSKGKHVRCQFLGSMTAPIEDTFLGTHLYRIAQEAVSNAVRHGKAKHITVRLSEVVGHMRLEVRDDGRGFLKGSEPKGMGLSNMKYRADSIGARLDISSIRGHGTIVACELPLRLLSTGKKIVQP